VIPGSGPRPPLAVAGRAPLSELCLKLKL